MPALIDLVYAEEDRRARRRKLGLPEELNEEEKAQEAAAAAQKAEATKKRGSFVTVKPVSGMLLRGAVCIELCGEVLLFSEHLCFPTATLATRPTENPILITSLVTVTSVSGGPPVWFCVWFHRSKQGTACMHLCLGCMTWPHAGCPVHSLHGCIMVQVYKRTREATHDWRCWYLQWRFGYPFHPGCSICMTHSLGGAACRLYD